MSVVQRDGYRIGGASPSTPAVAMTHPHEHDEGGHDRRGWRAVWRIGRVAFVLAAAAVLGANLVRCYIIPAAADRPGGAHPAPSPAVAAPAR